MRKGQNGDRPTVLVVDDAPFIRIDMAETLRQAGFNVEEASNSDEALKKLNGGGYPLGVLVTDVQMPGAMNGYELAKRFRNCFPQAVIAVISGIVRPSPGDMPPNAIFLSKPISPEQL